MIIWLLFLALIAFGIFWFARSSTRQRLGEPQASPRRSPGLEVLDESYARGQINRDEYLQKRRDILGE